MKKISRELLKNYLKINLIFLIFILSTLLLFIKSLEIYSKNEIFITDNFLAYECNEIKDKMKENNLELLFNEALKEAPKFAEISIIFKYHNNYFFEKNKNLLFTSLPLETLNKSNGFFKIGILNFYILKKTVSLPNGEFIEVFIIKEMFYLKKIVLYSTLFFLFFLLVTLSITIKISKNFYSKFKNVVDEFKKITDNLNLDNLSNRINTTTEYEEFNNIIVSYNDMLRRLEYQSDSQTEFVNNASHELKTPIFIISSYCKLIKRWGIDNKEVLKESIIAIEQESKKMKILTNKLLFLAKNDVKKIDKKKIQLDLLIKDIVKELSLIYPTQKIELFLDSSFVYSDEFLLKQLLKNLIENAMKYGNDNLITISYIQNKKVLKIKDRGIGIEKKELDKIFEKFYMVNRNRNLENNSYGLGLSIVKKISHLLNIIIDIHSEINIGTEINVIFP